MWFFNGGMQCLCAKVSMTSVAPLSNRFPSFVSSGVPSPRSDITGPLIWANGVIWKRVTQPKTFDCDPLTNPRQYRKMFPNRKQSPDFKMSCIGNFSKVPSRTLNNSLVLGSGTEELRKLFFVSRKTHELWLYDGRCWRPWRRDTGRESSYFTFFYTSPNPKTNNWKRSGLILQIKETWTWTRIPHSTGSTFPSWSILIFIRSTLKMNNEV